MYVFVEYVQQLIKEKLEIEYWSWEVGYVKIAQRKINIYVTWEVYVGGFWMGAYNDCLFVVFILSLKTLSPSGIWVMPFDPVLF